MMAIAATAHPDGASFSLKVAPGASCDRLMGELGGAIKVAVSRPAEGGAANAAVVALPADAPGEARSAVRIIRSHTGPRKEVAVSGLTIAEPAGRPAGLCPRQGKPGKG